MEPGGVGCRVWNSSKWFQVDSGGGWEGDMLRTSGFMLLVLREKWRYVKQAKGSWSLGVLEWSQGSCVENWFWRKETENKIRRNPGGRSKEGAWNQHGGQWGCEGETNSQECLLFWFKSSFNPLGSTGEKCKAYMPKERGLRKKSKSLI